MASRTVHALPAKNVSASERPTDHHIPLYVRPVSLPSSDKLLVDKVECSKGIIKTIASWDNTLEFHWRGTHTLIRTRMPPIRAGPTALRVSSKQWRPVQHARILPERNVPASERLPPSLQPHIRPASLFAIGQSISERCGRHVSSEPYSPIRAGRTVRRVSSKQWRAEQLARVLPTRNIPANGQVIASPSTVRTTNELVCHQQVRRDGVCERVSSKQQQT